MQTIYPIWRPASKVRINLVGPLLLAFTLQWLELGPLPISQLALFLPLVALTPMLSASRLATVPWLFVVYFVFLGALAMGLPLSQDLGAGMTAVARGTVYSVLGYFTYMWLLNEEPKVRIGQLANAVFWVVPGFFAIFYISALSAGVDLIGTVIQTFSTGNPYYLQYRMFNVTLNGGITEDGLSSAARHGIVISLLTVIYLHLLLRRMPSRLGNALCIAVVMFALLSLSRSALLGAALGLICYMFFRLAERKIKWTRVILVLGLGFALALAQGGLGDGLSTILREKFLEDILNNPRVFEFLQIVERLNERPVFGWGTGTGLGLFALDAQYPHNFILYGWHQTGLIGLAITVFFVFVIITYIVKCTSSAMRHAPSDRDVARLFILAAMLMCFVLVRLMFAKAGLLAVPEWIALCLACFSARCAMQMARNPSHLVSYPQQARR